MDFCVFIPEVFSNQKGGLAIINSPYVTSGDIFNLRAFREVTTFRVFTNFAETWRYFQEHLASVGGSFTHILTYFATILLQGLLCYNLL